MLFSKVQKYVNSGHLANNEWKNSTKPLFPVPLKVCLNKPLYREIALVGFYDLHTYVVHSTRGPILRELKSISRNMAGNCSILTKTILMMSQITS